MRIAPLVGSTTQAMKRISLVMVLIIALMGMAPARSEAHFADCQPASGCVPKEKGTNAGWWATSWYKASSGTCAGDWVVTYSTTWWKSEWWPRVRVWAADWSKISWPLYSGSHVQALDGVPPSIVLCFGARFSENDIKGTYVWLTP